MEPFSFVIDKRQRFGLLKIHGFITEAGDRQAHVTSQQLNHFEFVFMRKNHYLEAKGRSIFE